MRAIHAGPYVGPHGFAIWISPHVLPPGAPKFWGRDRGFFHTGISIVNAAPAVANIHPEIFQLADVFCVNESEAECITGIKNLTILNVQEAVDKLLEMGCNTIIITFGSCGAIFASRDNNKINCIPTDKVKSVDTTGAGDAFLGAFAYFTAYHPNLSIEEKIKRSCTIATQSVLKTGTQTSFPRKKDLPMDLFS